MKISTSYLDGGSSDRTILSTLVMDNSGNIVDRYEDSIDIPYSQISDIDKSSMQARATYWLRKKGYVKLTKMSKV